MPDPANLSDPRRLDELAAVTKEYARYSRRSFGFALSARGAWFLAALAVGAASVPGACIAFALAPGIWLALVPRARAHYQRRGSVTEKEAAAGGMDVLAPIFLWTWAVLGPLLLVLSNAAWARSVGALGWAALAPAAGAFVVYPMLARSRLQGVVDRALTVAFVMLAALSGPLAVSGGSAVGRFAIIAAGAAWVALGIYDHVRFRRLECRLTALQEGRP